MCNGCNQKRAVYASENYSVPPGMVRVKLIGNNPFVTNGDVTGRMYVFRHLNDIIFVDKRDAITMKDKKGLRIL